MITECSTGNIPPGYKQTEVGMIPIEWDTTALNQHCSKLNVGFVGVCERYYTSENNGVMLIRTGNLYGQKFKFQDLKYVTRSFHELNKKSQTRKGDILIARHGSSGSAVLVPSNIEEANTLNIVIIRTITNKLDNLFAQYAINSDGVKKQVLEVTAGSTQGVINTGEIAKLIIPKPSIIEQYAIAEALSDTDALIESLEQLIAKKRQIKQGAMQELLTGKRRLPGFETRRGYKQTEVGAIPEDWNTVTLSKVCTLHNGRAYALHEWENTGVPVIRLQNLTGGNEYYYSTLQLPEQKYCHRGDLLYMWSATFGPYIWMGDKAIYHYHIWKVVPQDEQSTRQYLYYKLMEITEEKKMRASNGGTMLHVTKESMESTLIALPPLPEQIAIATILSDMDSEITALEEKLAKARQIKQGMMQELLTGKIRLI